MAQSTPAADAAPDAAATPAEATTDATTTDTTAEAPAASPAAAPVQTPGIIVSAGVRYREEDAKRLGITADSTDDAAAVANNTKPVGPQKKAGTTPAPISKSSASTR